MCIFIECRLNAISMAQSEEEYADMVRDLKKQPIYLQNKSLQGWFEKRWLSEYKVKLFEEIWFRRQLTERNLSYGRRILQVHGNQVL